jgi:hypothetical protein
MVQRLEVTRARGLNAKIVAIFYRNLKQFYKFHNYDPTHIMNYDESKAQIRKCG